MNGSFYQGMKPIINELLGLTNDAIHMHIGFFALILSFLAIKKKINPYLYLLPGFVISILMEILDIRDDLRFTGQLKLMKNLHDIINTNLIPLVIVWVFLVRVSKTRTS